MAFSPSISRSSSSGTPANASLSQSAGVRPRALGVRVVAPEDDVSMPISWRIATSALCTNDSAIRQCSASTRSACAARAGRRGAARTRRRDGAACRREPVAAHLGHHSLRSGWRSKTPPSMSCHIGRRGAGPWRRSVGVVDDLRQQVVRGPAASMFSRGLDAGQELALLLAVARVDHDGSPSPQRDQNGSKNRS